MDHDHGAPRPDAPGPAVAAVEEALAALDGLEADLAAVDTAIAELDRITADGGGGEAAARAIEVAVPAERFGGGASELVGDGLLDE